MTHLNKLTRFHNFTLKKLKGIAKRVESKPWQTFCVTIEFIGKFKFLINALDCISTLIPPKPISPLEITVFACKLILVVAKSMFPRVISTSPESTLSTTFCLSVTLNTPQIALATLEINPIFFSRSMIRKLSRIYTPTINIELRES